MTWIVKNAVTLAIGLAILMVLWWILKPLILLLLIIVAAVTVCAFLVKSFTGDKGDP